MSIFIYKSLFIFSTSESIVILAFNVAFNNKSNFILDFKVIFLIVSSAISLIFLSFHLGISARHV